MYSKKYYQKNEYGYNAINRVDHNKIVSEIKPGNKRVLEIGCGMGVLLSRINVPIKNKFGTESNNFAVKMCKDKGLNVIRHRDTENLPFDNDYFDIVVMNEVIEHLKNPHKSIKEIYRILSKKGLLIITTPNKSILVKNLDDSHIWEMTFKEAKNFIENNNFFIIKHEISGNCVYDFVGRKFLFPIGRFFMKHGLANNLTSSVRDKVDHSRISKFRSTNVWSGAQQFIMARKK